MKVELGAGARPQPGFLALDLSPDVRPDVVANVLDLPFADGSIDELRAVDAAEHVSYRQTDALFAEVARVLKPGGALFVQVPAADEIMRWFVEEPERLTTPPELPSTPLAGAQWRLLGGHADGRYAAADGPWWLNAHGTMFGRESLMVA